MSTTLTEPVTEIMTDGPTTSDPFSPLVAALTHVEDSAIVFSAEGELVIWNPGAEKLYGYSFEEARRKDISFLAPPEESGDTIKLFARALSGQPVPPRLVERIQKDGTRVRVSLRVSPLEQPDGSIFGVLFMSRDVVSEVDRETRLTELQLREREIATLVPDALYVHRQGKIVWVNQAAVDMFGAQSTTDLLGRMAWDFIVEADLDKVLKRHAALGPAGSTSPILVHRKRLDGHAFPTEARGAAIIWEDEPATLMVVRDLSEQERALTALAESELRQKELAEICPDAILVHVDGEIVFGNDAAVEMFAARSVRDLIGRTNESIVHPDDWRMIVGSWDAAEPDDGNAFLQVRQIRLDGTGFIGEGRGKAVVWEGQEAWMVVVRDITDRIRVQDALKESEARQRDFAEISPDAMLVHLDGEIVFANEAALAMFGAKDRDEFIGRNVTDTIHPDDRSIVAENWDAWRKGDGLDLMDVRRLRLDGTSFHGEGRHRSIFWEGRTAYLVVIRDVSARIANQRALQESEERHRQIVDVSPDSILVHVDDRIVFANAAAHDMYGAEDDELIGLSSLAVIPDDRKDFVLAQRKQLVAGGIAPKVEARRKRLDGTEFIAEVTGSNYTWNGEAAVLTIARDVSDRVFAEQARVVLEERYRKILELTPAATFVHVGGKITYVNPAAIEMFGAERSDDLIGYEVSELIHPGDRDRISDRQQAMREGVNMPLDRVRRLRLDGTSFETSYSATKIDWHDQQGFLVLTEDITEQLAKEEALQQSESRHRTITEASPEAILVHLDHKIVFANRAAAEMFGVQNADTLLGRRALDLVHPDDREDLLASNEPLAPGDILPPTVSRRLRDTGEVFHSESTRSGYSWDGQTAMMAVIRDISERFAAEQKIRDYTEELERTNEELERFAYVASHDLKEPLRMVSSFCGLLQERYADKLDEQANEFIRFAVDGATRMHGLIEDLLKMSQTGTTDLIAETVEVSGVVNDVKTNLGPLIAETGAEITCDDLPMVVGDRTLLTQLFQNLVSNAIKFRSDKTPVITIESTSRGAEHAFSVSDNGIGFDLKHNEKIFEVFKTLHARDKFEGNGIGLSICKKVVERHGGKIWVDSMPGQGSSFWFTLPAMPEVQKS